MNKRNLFFIILIPVVIITSVFSTPTKIAPQENYVKDDIKYPSVFKLTGDDKTWIENKLNEMSLAEKCAQMIMPAVYRDDLNINSFGYKKISGLVNNFKIGGLILFQGGLTEQAAFINNIQAISDIPLIISSDFERGLGNRIDDAIEFPHAMAVGSTYNRSLVYEMGKAIAKECSILGVNMIFAPVADINDNPLNPIINIRAFSEDKNEVSDFVKSFINGTKNSRLLTSAKHFPGHGDTEIDSHYELPVIKGDADHLKTNELHPFKEAIAAGVQSIMIGHLEVPAFDPIPGTPSSLSSSVVTNLLKKEMGFDGLIITDAMNMNAVTKYFSASDAVVMAVIAGVDIILMPKDPELAISALEKAVVEEKISKERIDESVRKILAAKRWLKIEETKYNDSASVQISLKSDEHFRLAEKIANESVTLIKDELNLIPLNIRAFKNIACISITDGPGSERTSIFRNNLESRIGNVNQVFFNRNSNREDYNKRLNELKNSDLIIIASYIDVKIYHGPINLSAEQKDFISDVLKMKIPTVLISFRNPYFANLFPEAPVILNTFSHSRVSQHAALRAILGEIDIKGTLPVTIPETEFALRHGLYIPKSKSPILEYDRLNGKTYDSIDNLIASAIDEKIFPGAVISFGKNGKLLYKKAFGNSGFGDGSFKLKSDDNFDIGYTNRIVSGLTALLLLIDQKLITPDDKVHTYFKDFYSYDKKDITIRHLLSHSSGFGAQIKDFDPGWSREELIHSLGWQILDYKTGKDIILSPVNDIILQLIIEEVSGKSLDEFLAENLFSKLGLSSTHYLTGSGSGNTQFPFSVIRQPDYVVARTQIDEVSRIMDGITTVQGLYSTSIDMSIFAQMIVQRGYYDNKQIITAKTLQPFILNFNAINQNGCAIWVDDKEELFIIIMTGPGLKTTSTAKFIQFFSALKNLIYDEPTLGVIYD